MSKNEIIDIYAEAEEILSSTIGKLKILTIKADANQGHELGLALFEIVKYLMTNDEKVMNAAGAVLSKMINEN